MKKLDQYIIREMIVPFLIGTVVVVLMFQINTYIALAKDLNLESVPFAAVLQFILYKTPEYLNMTLPAGMALAASLAMSRITRESELTAMRSAGARILRVVWPVVIFGTVVGIGNFFLVERVIPKSTKEANRIGAQAAILGLSSTTFSANKMISLRQFTARFGTVQREGEDLLIRDVLLIESPGQGQFRIIAADQGNYRNGVWTFQNAYYRVLEGEDLYQAYPGEDFVVNERIVVDEMFMPPAPEEQTIAQLKSAIDTAERLGSGSRHLWVQLHVKYAVPAACIVFAIVGPVFAIWLARSGGFVGVLVSFVMVLLYYNAFVISTQIIGKLEAVPPWFAAWLPNILFASLGVFAIRRLE